MRFIDLTHILDENIPVWPGTEQPSLTVAATYEEHGFREMELRLTSHTGTHMDAPAHLMPDGKTLDEFKIEQFCGKALIVDIRKGHTGVKIADTEVFKQADFLLFYTGWEDFWNTKGYFEGFPAVPEGMIDMAVKAGKKGVGVDTLSIDAADSVDMPNHRRILSTDSMVIVENLCNLKGLAGQLIEVCFLPLKFRSSDGAPVRAVALLD